MKKLLAVVVSLFLLFALCLPTATVQASELSGPLQDIAAQVSPVRGTARVVEVTSDGDAMTLMFDDYVWYAESFTAAESDEALGIAEGEDYHMIVVDGENGTATILLQTDNPALQEMFIATETEIMGLGTPDDNTLMIGDTIDIRVQAAEEEGYIDVTFDIFRDNTSAGTFSFVVEGDMADIEAAEEQAEEEVPAAVNDDQDEVIEEQLVIGTIIDAAQLDDTGLLFMAGDQVEIRILEMADGTYGMLLEFYQESEVVASLSLDVDLDSSMESGTESSSEMAAANVIDRQAIVVGVNRPGDAEFDMVTVANGDLVQFTKYEPAEDNLDVGIVAGMTYNMFMLTQEDETQAFIVWSPEEPIWQDLLSSTDTVVAGIGVPGPNTLMSGDDVQISVQEAEDGGIDVTLDVWRDNEAVATFSFVVDSEYPVEAEEANGANPTACSDAVQGKIAWDYNGSTEWGGENLQRLCNGAESSIEPANCFEQVMHGGVDWGGGTQWGWSNALDLCESTLDADGTIQCFESAIESGDDWEQAILDCGV